MTEALEALIGREIGQPVDPRVVRLAAAVAARHGGARAVLFYGSCLRTAELDGQMLDFYLIVDGYERAYDKAWLATANRLLPPNVFPIEADGLAAKYAVLSEADFARLCSDRADNVSVWARFAQPVRLVWADNDAACPPLVAAIAEAVVTLFELTLPVLDPGQARDPLEIWREGFARTYAAELRAERQGRGGSIVDTDPDRFEAVGHAALAEISRRRGSAPADALRPAASQDAARRRWRRLQRRGKWLTAARLAKASATFAGGIDYLAWKIERHAGTPIALKPWQRRWPIAGALTLLPRLLRSGAVR